MGRGAAQKEKNLNELKQELELDVHKVEVSELLKRSDGLPSSIVSALSLATSGMGLTHS